MENGVDGGFCKMTRCSGIFVRPVLSLESSHLLVLVEGKCHSEPLMLRLSSYGTDVTALHRDDSSTCIPLGARALS